MTQEGATASFAALEEQRREQAMTRFAVLRPHLEEGVPPFAPLLLLASRSGRRSAGWRVTARLASLDLPARPVVTLARAGCILSLPAWWRAWR